MSGHTPILPTSSSHTCSWRLSVCRANTCLADADCNQIVTQGGDGGELDVAACNANALCAAWFQCEMASQDNSGDPCDGQINTCIADPTCLPLVLAAQDGVCDGCVGNDLCNTVVTCVRENVDPNACP